MAVIDDLVIAVDEIEQTLGITPNGVYADVRVRLDILESRINTPGAPIPDGYNPFYIDGYGGVSVSVGDGYPTENRQDGSLYLRKDGYNYEGLYSRKNGTWMLIPTISNTITPADGYILKWNSAVLEWEPTQVFDPFIFIGKPGALSTSTDGYIISNMSEAVTEDFPAFIASSDCILKNLTITMSAAMAAGETAQIIIRKNSADTLLTATLDDASPLNTAGNLRIEQDFINQISLVNGDKVTIRFISSAGCDAQNVTVKFNVSS